MTILLLVQELRGRFLFISAVLKQRFGCLKVQCSRNHGLLRGVMRGAKRLELLYVGNLAALWPVHAVDHHHLLNLKESARLRLHLHLTKS
jgi:hypothetical protein